ncbi:hypothetical protein B0H17DRAFT_1325937 [Mycena rosella]|uniref:BRCT domain-containing protein n=1 Tax=Mycena rosella TaxID=1033263 RepID=A0AAD7GVJ4_MYCRO|nr:hypothetical protein B0H17DRAFT_1325937 [Mycena rosella]
MDAGLSHTAEGATSPLFVEDGTPVKFYVDPGSVSARPKLIRTLKSAGASIASDPKTADFILVESNTPTGQRFTRDWNDEKKVLEVKWVSKTIAAGRLLKESDEWGGCLAVVNPNADLEDVVDQNHLPTPRPTPVELPPNGGPLPPPHIPPSDSRHSSQRSTGPPSLYPLMPPHQMPSQFAQQPGQQLFHSYQGPPLPTYQVDPNVYAMAIMDILRAQGFPQGPLAGFPQAPGMQNGIPPGPMFAPQGMNPMMNPYPQLYSKPSGLSPAAHSTSASPLSVFDPLPPSLSRRPSADVKGKGRAAGSKIFISPNGEPLSFYVAIDVNNRTAPLNSIKKHGGQISTQIITANYAILSSRSKDFENLLETVISSNRKAVKPAFVQACVEENELLETAGFEFELPAKLSPAKKTDAEKRQAINERKAKARKAKKDAAVKEEKNSPGPSYHRVPSPTPPADHLRVLHSSGRYRYTEVETKYALQYAAILFERDTNMPFTALAAKLNIKMPHHSEKAWCHYLTRTMREDIDNVRKRAIIAYRKEELQRQSTADEPPAKRPKPNKAADVVPEAKADAGAKGKGKAAAATEDDEEQDLNAIAHFFANGGDEETDGDEDQATKDARVWARLTAQTPCRTEATWEVFYNTRHHRVTDLYELLVGAQDESPAE